MGPSGLQVIIRWIAPRFYVKRMIREMLRR